MALEFERDGVALSEDAVGGDTLRKLAQEFETAGVRVGARPFVLSPTVKALIGPEGALGQRARALAGASVRPVRILAFDKTPDANWHRRLERVEIRLGSIRHL